MTLKKIILLGGAAALALSMSACGRLATNADPDDLSSGQVNTGDDKNEGTTNTGTDANTGVVNGDAPANQDGVDVGGSDMRDADGKCINDKDEDNICNEEDSDLDGDGIANVDDPDIDGDDIANVDDEDVDNDGIDNIDDNDMDGDGIANENDGDMDGDGTPNLVDDDMDGDGIKNIDDNDMDGDGIANEDDDDMDGDGIKNTDDRDMDGDGIFNTDDNDMDGDGIANEDDDDMDGDGIANDKDNDQDGDGVPNASDTDANGDGQADDGSIVEGKLAYFSRSGTVSLDAAQLVGNSYTGSQEFDFQDLRDEANKQNADVSTVTPYDVEVVADPASAGLVSAVGDLTYTMRVYYVLPGNSTKVLIARTPAATVNAVGDLVAGVSFSGGQILPTENYATFQGLFAKPQYTKVDLVVEMELLDAPDSALSGNVVLNYVVKANAKIDY